MNVSFRGGTVNNPLSYFSFNFTLVVAKFFFEGGKRFSDVPFVARHTQETIYDPFCVTMVLTNNSMLVTIYPDPRAFINIIASDAGGSMTFKNSIMGGWFKGDF